jgi:hypothetical protein
MYLIVNGMFVTTYVEWLEPLLQVCYCMMQSTEDIIIFYFAYSVQRSVNGLKNETEMHELKVRPDSFLTFTQ